MYVRRAASKSLGMIGPQAVPALIDALKQRDAEVSYRAARALALIGQSAVKRLKQCLANKDAFVREGAVRALAYMRRPPPKFAVQAFISVLSDDTPAVRLWAVRGLGKMGQEAKAAIFPLICALKDPDIDVQDEVVTALGRIGPPDVNSRSFIGRKGVSILVDGLREQSPIARLGAAFALGDLAKFIDIEPNSICTRESVLALAEALRDPNESVRRNAAASLGKVGPKAKDAVAFLIEALKEEDGIVRYRAANTLVKIHQDLARTYQTMANKLKLNGAIGPYDGFVEDLRMLRKKIEVEGPNHRLSSPDALVAAGRVFKESCFKGMTKKEVLNILGDPRTISGYGQPQEHGSNAPLVYDFVSGYTACRYVLYFREGMFERIEFVPGD